MEAAVVPNDEMETNAALMPAGWSTPVATAGTTSPVRPVALEGTFTDAAAPRGGAPPSTGLFFTAGEGWATGDGFATAARPAPGGGGGGGSGGASPPMTLSQKRRAERNKEEAQARRRAREAACAMAAAAPPETAHAAPQPLQAQQLNVPPPAAAPPAQRPLPPPLQARTHAPRETPVGRTRPRRATR
jgi:hypothetical protein